MNRGVSYSYDAKGRVIQKRRSGGVFGEDVTITTYNDLGDKASETAITVTNPDRDREYGLTEAGALIPSGEARPAQPPTVSEEKPSGAVDDVLLRPGTMSSGIWHVIPPFEAFELQVGRLRLGHNIILIIFCFGGLIPSPCGSDSSLRRNHSGRNM